MTVPLWAASLLSARLKLGCLDGLLHPLLRTFGTFFESRLVGPRPTNGKLGLLISTGE